MYVLLGVVCCMGMDGEMGIDWVMVGLVKWYLCCYMELDIKKESVNCWVVFM